MSEKKCKKGFVYYEDNPAQTIPVSYCDLCQYKRVCPVVGRLTPRALDDCPRCDICGTETVEMGASSYACPECGNRQ